MVRAGNRGRASFCCAKSVCRKRAGTYRELLERQQRQQTLGALAQHMAYDKQVMGKGRKRRLQPEEAGGQAGVFRWKAERKR